MAAAAAATAPDNLRGLDEILDKALGAKLDLANDDDVDLSERTATVASPSNDVATNDDSASLSINDCSENAEEAATAILDDLLRFRDQYFESHSLQDAHRKKADVAAEIQRALPKLETLNEPLTADGKQAYYLTLRGRINNANQSYSEDAYLDLSKAIKLDPRLSDAWNALGECYWYKGDMEEARNCFEGSLKHSKNKAALRNMSIVMRQLLPTDQEEKFVSIRASVDKAKEAVSLDTNDGMSWYVLGTAYLSLFFISNQNPKVLRQCLSAYSQAEKDPSVKNLPDLYYNRAMAYKHMEEYKFAIAGFHTALCLEPDWIEAKTVRDDILLFLRTIQDHVTTRGKIKGKKLTSFVNSIKPEVALGPFAGGSYTAPGNGRSGSASGGGDAVKLTHVPFRELTPGPNANKVVVGKVTSSVTNECITAFAFTMVDADKNCVAVTLYNLKAGVGVIIGDTVAIAEPFMEKIDFEFDPDSVFAEGNEGATAGAGDSAELSKKDASAATKGGLSKAKFEFASLRVPTPVVVVVNGKKWGRDKEAFTEMRVNSQPSTS